MRISFVLVRPLRAANVGAVARAMKNFGHDDLRVVGACDALPGGASHSEACALAWNARDVLERARRYETLAQAIEDLHLVAASTSRAEPGRDGHDARGFASEAAAMPQGAMAGVVFGPEDKGLVNAELDLCRTRLRIPTFDAQPSLNLGQAAVIVAYEAAMATREQSSSDELEPATEGEVERLVHEGERLLLDVGYLNASAPEHVLGELRRLLSRARPSSREITLLLGLVHQLEWACRRPR